MYIFIILTAYLFYYLHNIFKHHFWYNFNKKSSPKNFFFNFLNPKIQTKNNLSIQEYNQLIQLYKNYFPNINVNYSKINNFLKYMPKPYIIYLPNNGGIVASVFNSMVPIIYRNTQLLSNFVDYAVVKRLERNKGVFVDLMNYVSHISNKNDVDVIIFKIDINPIPSLVGGYALISNYYYIEKSRIKCKSGDISLYEYNLDDLRYLRKFKLYAKLDENILGNNDERITLCNNGTIINFKRNNENNLELMYILNPQLDRIREIIGYLRDNYNFKYLVLDDIGDNGEVLKVLDMTCNYSVYHYMLGMDVNFGKREFYYYF